MQQAHVHFSVIVPTYNRPRQLTACLAALARLDYPRDRFEVIVIDDGGNAPLHNLLATFSQTIEVKLLRQSNRGPASARNTGAARAQGQFLAFTDDDCCPAPDWLRALATCFAREPYSALGGSVTSPRRSACKQRCCATERVRSLRQRVQPPVFCSRWFQFGDGSHGNGWPSLKASV